MSLSGLPVDSAGYQFTRADGGRVVQASSGGETECGDCAEPSLPVWFVADGARSATPARTAREVSLAGVPLGPPARLPTGYVIYQATDRGLLLAPVSQPPGPPAYKLWNPADPHASRTFDGLIAASPAEIAWTSPCAATCRVQLLDLATRRHAVVELPAGSTAVDAAFSPGGRFLASVLASLCHPAGGGGLPAGTGPGRAGRRLAGQDRPRARRGFRATRSADPQARDPPVA